MNNFEHVKSMNIDELTSWLYSLFRIYEDAPWEEWFSKNYCNNCETEIVKTIGSDREIPCNWCELNDKCKFFQDKDEIPVGKDVVKMWLESEYIDE